MGTLTNENGRYVMKLNDLSFFFKCDRHVNYDERMDPFEIRDQRSRSLTNVGCLGMIGLELSG